MDHDHALGLPADYQDPEGRPVDAALLDRFVGAAFDGCTSCQDAELTLIVHDGTTCARLVELACTMTASMYGGLPPSMTDPNEPGPSSQEFRLLARTGADGRSKAMFVTCLSMTTAERREAANTAADQIVGNLYMAAINEQDD